ncbi:MAG: vWA domain-containing protein [Candidatus Hodarchaeales archaeon]|jgi:hypothetical protein
MQKKVPKLVLSCLFFLYILSTCVSPVTASGGTIATDELKVDVVFVFDATPSMMDELGYIKRYAPFLLYDIREAIPDSAFGVGSFTDYPGTYESYEYSARYGEATDYAFAMNQDINADIDTSSTVSAINTIVPGGGGDSPEDYVRAVWETMNYNWRDGARKIVVLFGDAPTHTAPSGQELEKPWELGTPLFTGTYGGDPGPDQVMFTDDDLDYAPVIQLADDEQITFITIDCQTSYGLGFADDAHNNLEYIAYMTSGTRILYNGPTIINDIVEQIIVHAEEPSNPLIQVIADIKRKSLRMKKKNNGIFIVAILGTEDFDVMTIDTDTIEMSLEGLDTGVSPKISMIRDCNGDGIVDLVLKFGTQELVDTLQLDGHVGETISLTIKGNLLEQYGGTQIQGQDNILIKGKI